MKKIIFIIALIVVCLPLPSLADVLLEGYHAVNNCNKLINMADFPEYDFFLNISFIGDDLQFIKSDSCFSYYKFSTATVGAIKKSNLAKLERQAEGKSEDEVNELMKNSHYFIMSDYQLPNIVEPVLDSNPLVGVESQFKIISVGSDLQLALAKKIKKYKNGTTDEEVFEVQPVKSGLIGRLTSLADNWYFLIPILGALGLILVFLYKRSYKK